LLLPLLDVLVTFINVVEDEVGTVVVEVLEMAVVVEVEVTSSLNSEG